MNVSPTTDEGYKLLHEGILAMARVEENGIRIDQDYLARALLETKDKIVALRDKIMAHTVWAAWRRRFGALANLDSRPQLGAVLFEEMGYTPPDMTEGDRYATDEATLESLNIGFVKGYLRLQRLQKAHGTYLSRIQRELDKDGRFRPVFNLHTTLTYRSSSDFQNIPTRNPEIGKLIRQAVIASPGCVIVENDFKGVEVSVATCYHKDPKMIEYIEDETKDMHRDMAMQLYLIKRKQWAAMKKTKPVRHAAKNKFVFPVFYGDWYVNCARNLWEEIDRQSLLGPGEIPMREHLANMGITGLGEVTPDADGKYPRPTPGTFAHHLQEVENDFWNNRFRVYGRWKKEWYNEYVERGYFQSYTGFMYQGVMRRNEVINYAVQGSAFHCLLWSIVRIQRELTKRKMRTKIINQIHDSIVADVFIPELDEYLAIVRRIAEDDVRTAWPWLILPLQIEVEISPIGMTWHDKREVKMNRKEGTYSVEGFNGSAQDLLKFWNGQGTV